MTVTTIRASEPRELLAYLPFRLGFRPRESLVVASIRARRGRVGLVARVDLADVVDPARGRETARALATHVWRDGAEQAVAVVYADGARDAGRWRPEVPLAARHAREALEDHVGPTAVWVVDEQRYFSLDCREPACCPPEGRPLTELDATLVAAEMVLAGASVAEHRSRLTEVRPATADARYNVRRVARRWQQQRDRAQQVGDQEALAGWRVRSLEAWRRVLGATVPPPRELGRLSAGLHDALVRDAVVVSVATTVDHVLPALEDPARRGLLGQGFERLVTPGLAPPPSRELLEPVERALREVVAHATEGRHAPALTVLALLAWWAGDGVAAGSWLDKALDADPEHRLAGLLASTLAAGIAPGWAAGPEAHGAGLR